MSSIRPSASPDTFPPRLERHAEASVRRLWLYGLGMLMPALYFAVCYPLWGNTGRLMDVGQMSRYQPLEFVGFVGGFVVLFTLYVLALRESRELRPADALRPIFTCGLALTVVMAAMYPVNAIDMFLYAVRSHLFTAYGANPNAALPRNFPTDPWRHLAHPEWASTVSPYGPLWNLIAAPITFVAGGNIAVALIGFKLLAVLALLAGAWAIMRTLATTAPARSATGALFYLWNPLVLWEAIGNGHNDVVMTLPLLLALFAFARRRDWLVIPLLVAGAAIKYAPVLVIPLAAVALWRRSPNRQARIQLVGRSLALSLIVVAVALAPFYNLTAIRASIAQQAGLSRNSPAQFVVEMLAGYVPAAQIHLWAVVMGESIVLAVAVWQAFMLMWQPERLPRAGFEVLYALLLCATWNFNPWYLIWPVALAALAPWGWPAWRMIAWTAGALASYAVFIWIQAWLRLDFAALEFIGVPVAFGATIALTLVDLVLYVMRGGDRSIPVERMDALL